MHNNPMFDVSEAPLQAQVNPNGFNISIVKAMLSPYPAVLEQLIALKDKDKVNVTPIKFKQLVNDMKKVSSEYVLQSIRVVYDNLRNENSIFKNIYIPYKTKKTSLVKERNKYNAIVRHMTPYMINSSEYFKNEMNNMKDIDQDFVTKLYNSVQNKNIKFIELLNTRVKILVEELGELMNGLNPKMTKYYGPTSSSSSISRQDRILRTFIQKQTKDGIDPMPIIIEIMEHLSHNLDDNATEIKEIDNNIKKKESEQTEIEKNIFKKSRQSSGGSGTFVNYLYIADLSTHIVARKRVFDNTRVLYKGTYILISEYKSKLAKRNKFKVLQMR
jgi:hypothetical protein